MAERGLRNRAIIHRSSRNTSTENLLLGLFPSQWAGVQDLIWRYFENDLEGITFKLNDIYYEEFVGARDRLAFCAP